MSIQATPLQIAVRAIVHHAASELARLGVDAPDSEVADVAIIEAIGMRVYLGVTKVEPAKLILTPLGRQFLGIDPGKVIKPGGNATVGDASPLSAKEINPGINPGAGQPAPPATVAPGPYRRVHREILRVAPDKMPLTVKGLAKAARYKYSSYFREAVAKLLQSGELVRVCGGIVRAPDKTDKLP